MLTIIIVITTTCKCTFINKLYIFQYFFVYNDKMFWMYTDMWKINDKKKEYGSTFYTRSVCACPMRRKKKLFVSTNPTAPIFCADLKHFLVFVNDLRAKIFFPYEKHSNLLILSLHLYVVILYMHMCS